MWHSIFIWFWLFEMGSSSSHFVAQASLKSFFCLSFLSLGTPGRCHHAWLGIPCLLDKLAFHTAFVLSTWESRLSSLPPKLRFTCLLESIHRCEADRWHDGSQSSGENCWEQELTLPWIMTRTTGRLWWLCQNWLIFVPQQLQQERLQAEWTHCRALNGAGQKQLQPSGGELGGQVNAQHLPSLGQALFCYPAPPKQNQTEQENRQECSTQ